MLTKAQLIGCHLWFVRNGTAFTLPAPGTASASAKPGATDAVWKKLGIVAEAELDPGNVEAVEVWEPSPGRLRRADIIRPRAYSPSPRPPSAFTSRSGEPLRRAYSSAAPCSAMHSSTRPSGNRMLPRRW